VKPRLPLGVRALTNGRARNLMESSMPALTAADDIALRAWCACLAFLTLQITVPQLTAHERLGLERKAMAG
jgi:hypothetical protein